MTKRRRKLIITSILAQCFLIPVLFWSQRDPGVAYKIITLGCIVLSGVGGTILYLHCNRVTRSWDTLLSTLNHQRHDAKNCLQVIYTMVQLDKREQVINYIRSLKTLDGSIACICHVKDIGTVSFMLEVFFYLKQSGYTPVIDASENTYISPIIQKYLWHYMEEYVSRLESSNRQPQDIELAFKVEYVKMVSALGNERVSLAYSAHSLYKMRELLWNKV